MLVTSIFSFSHMFSTLHKKKKKKKKKKKQEGQNGPEALTWISFT